MFNYFLNLTSYELIFLIIGFLGQGLFASRFIVQWIYSEKEGQSTIPVVFWYLSIMGGIGLLIYAISRKDPVIILGQSFGIFIYLRNLILIYRNKNEKILEKIIWLEQMAFMTENKLLLKEQIKYIVIHYNQFVLICLLVDDLYSI